MKSRINNSLQNSLSLSVHIRRQGYVSRSLKLSWLTLQIKRFLSSQILFDF